MMPAMERAHHTGTAEGLLLTEMLLDSFPLLLLLLSAPLSAVAAAVAAAALLRCRSIAARARGTPSLSLSLYSLKAALQVELTALTSCCSERPARLAEPPAGSWAAASSSLALTASAITLMHWPSPCPLLDAVKIEPAPTSSRELSSSSTSLSPTAAEPAEVARAPAAVALRRAACSSSVAFFTESCQKVRLRGGPPREATELPLPAPPALTGEEASLREFLFLLAPVAVAAAAAAAAACSSRPDRATTVACRFFPRVFKSLGVASSRASQLLQLGRVIRPAVCRPCLSTSVDSTSLSLAGAGAGAGTPVAAATAAAMDSCLAFCCVNTVCRLPSASIISLCSSPMALQQKWGSYSR